MPTPPDATELPTRAGYAETREIDQFVETLGRFERREIDGVAVGHRPGLIGSLLVGVAA